MFVFPGMSDTGNSVGAGLLMLDRLQPGFLKDRRRALETVYWGPEYADAQIEEALKGRLCRYEKLTEEQLIERSARAMHAGKVLGWFQGRMEFGPRALGNRSMLAAPTDRSINKWLNERLERTEFMPFAPSVLDEYAEEIFEGAQGAAHGRVHDHHLRREAGLAREDSRGGARRWDRAPAVGEARQEPEVSRADRALPAVVGNPAGAQHQLQRARRADRLRAREAVRALAEGRIDHLAIGNFWAEPAVRNPD